MNTSLSKDLIKKLQKDHNEILEYLINRDYQIQDLPPKNITTQSEGEAYTIAYPMYKG